MIQEELWIERLASGARLAYASSERLWKAFTTQLEIRLSEEIAIDFRAAGIWSLTLEPEYIAQVEASEGGGYILVPPCLRLSITSKLAHRRTIQPLSELAEAISLASGIRLERAERWLEVLVPALEELLQSQRAVYWKYIGILYPLEPGAGGYRLDLSEAFTTGLNRPFAAFAPTPIASIEGHPDLEVRSLKSALSWGTPYSVSFVPTPRSERGIEEIVVPAPSAVEEALPTEEEVLVSSVVEEATQTEEEPISSPVEEAPQTEEEPTSPPVEEAPQTEEESTSSPVEEAPQSEELQPQAELIPEPSSDQAVCTSRAQTEPHPTLIEAEKDCPTSEVSYAHTEAEVAPNEPAPAPLSSEEGGEPRQDEQAPHSSRRRLLALLPLVLLVGLCAIYLSKQRGGQDETPSPAKVAASRESSRALSAPTDTIASTPSLDTLPQPQEALLVADTTQRQEPKPIAPPTSRPVSRSASQWSNSPEEVITIKEGDTLANIAERKYGHKAFWVYIYEENRELLPDPHHATAGLILTLPASKKYRIDPDNTKSVSRALILQKSLSQ